MHNLQQQKIETDCEIAYDSQLTPPPHLPLSTQYPYSSDLTILAPTPPPVAMAW